MELNTVKIGQAIIIRTSSTKNSVFIKLRENLFFHAGNVGDENEWKDMKSLFGYEKDQLLLLGNNFEIFPLNKISNNRILDSIKYIFETMKH